MFLPTSQLRGEMLFLPVSVLLLWILLCSSLNFQKCILSCSVLLGCSRDPAGLQCPQHQAHAELQGASHLLGSFHSHHLKDTNTGSISQEWHEETPQACHQYRPYLTNGQQRQYSFTQPMFVFRERCRCEEREWDHNNTRLLLTTVQII